MRPGSQGSWVPILALDGACCMAQAPVCNTLKWEGWGGAQVLAKVLTVRKRGR